jgi:hypothetical protein
VSFSFDERLTRCPWSAYPAEAFEMVEMHNRATGPLPRFPFPGRYEDQPLWVGQAFDIIERVKRESELRESRKRTAEIKRATEEQRRKR